MAKSTQPAKSRETQGVGSAPAAKRAAPTAGRKPARSEARPDAPAAADRPRPPEPIGESAQPVLQPSPAVAADRDPAPASAASASGEPAVAPAAEVRAAIAKPPPPVSSSMAESPAPAAAAAALPEPGAAAAELALANAAMPWPSRSLVEGSVRIRSEMIAFTWQQAEHGLAVGRAVLASRSLPEIVALQTAYLGDTLERTLAHTLELARLSADMLRAGLQAPRAD